MPGYWSRTIRSKNSKRRMPRSAGTQVTLQNHPLQMGRIKKDIPKKDDLAAGNQVVKRATKVKNVLSFQRKRWIISIISILPVVNNAALCYLLGRTAVLVKHFHRLIPDTERPRKASIFPASLTQTDVQCEPLLPKISFK